MRKRYDELTDEDLARICHEAHLALRIGLNDSAEDVHWDAMTRDRQEMNINEIRMFREGKTLAEVHWAWVEWMISQGWRQGPSRNAVLKTHPEMVPYEETSVVSKAKLRQAQRIVFTHVMPYAAASIVERGLRDIPGADETVIREDLPEVCVTHRHFYPCGSRDGDCVFSSEPREVDEVYRECYEQ